MDKLGVHARLEETVLLKRTDTAGSPTSMRPSDLANFDGCGDCRTSARPHLRSFRQSLQDLRREQRLQDVHRQSVERAERIERHRQKDVMRELRSERQSRREPHDEPAARLHHESRHDRKRLGEKPKASKSDDNNSRQEASVSDSKTCDHDQEVSKTDRQSVQSASRKESKGEQTARADGKGGDASQAEGKSGQALIMVLQTAAVGKETGGRKTPEAGESSPATQADPKAVRSEKPASTNANQQIPDEKPGDVSGKGRGQGQHAAREGVAKQTAGSKKPAGAFSQTKVHSHGSTQVMPADSSPKAVRVPNVRMSGMASTKAGQAEAAKISQNQPVPVARDVRLAASDSHTGAKPDAAVVTQRLKPVSQSGAEKQGGQTDLSGGGHLAAATAQGSAPADVSESVARPFQHDLLQQIVDKAALHLKAGKTELRIDLKPEVLGHLRLHISADQRQVTLKILTESTWVKEMVEHHIGHLQAELQNHNLRIDRLDVSVAGDFQQTTGGNPQSGSSGREALHMAAHPTARDTAVSETVRQPVQTESARERVGLIDYFV